MNTCLIVFSSFSFFVYGISCFASTYMRREFERYGLPKYRRLTGILEILGASGLLTGLFLPAFGLIAALGLSLLMLLGFLVRIRIKDSPVKSSPALIYMLLNLYIFLQFLTTNS